MIIGVDLDNTIISFDSIFFKVAYEEGLISNEIPKKKNVVRDELRRRGLEKEWIRLQGIVYGKRIIEAEVFEGFEEFCEEACGRGHRLVIISHKTRFPFIGDKVDLHQSARNWICDKLFYKKGLIQLSDVYFELTKAEKINRICNVGCEFFIDDLPEILEDQAFPVNIKKILFDSERRFKKTYAVVNTWSEVLQYIK
ncbi:MAG: hypothetical protein N2035_02150 [Chthoniobacterales bacterium]|nr:hypothetical protein [Chthoniobacterales bacterium]